MATYSGPVCNARGSTDVIDTRIYGNPDDIRDAAAKVRKIYEALNDAYIEMSNSLVPLPEYWAGESANAYEATLNTFRKCTGENLEFAYGVWEAMRAYAQQLDYHYRDMETIRQNARSCGLQIANEYDILLPPPLGPEPTMPPQDAPMQEHDIYRADLFEYEQHKQRFEDFKELSDRAEDVRDDLEKWVKTHLLSLQSKPPHPFIKFWDEKAKEYKEAPWQFIPDVVDQSFAIRAASRQDKLTDAVNSFSKSMNSPKVTQIRPAVDLKIQRAMEAKQGARSAASFSSKVSTGATAAGGLLLAYDVATADNPSEKAISGIAGMIGGAQVASWVSAAVVRRGGSALLGTVLGGPVGTVAAIAITEGVAWSYRQLPLEYRERVDATLWHWPYYIGLGW